MAVIPVAVLGAILLAISPARPAPAAQAAAPASSTDVTFTTGEIAVRDLDATTSLFTGRLTGTDPSGKVVSDARFTHVFVKRAGRWQCVAGQSTPIAAPAR